jgi:hypothetical protein
LPKILSWISRNYFLDFEPDILAIHSWFEKTKKYRGIREAVRAMKLYRLSVTRAMSGQPLRDQGIKVDRLGYPLFLSPNLRKALHKDRPEAIRAVLTALNLSRMELGGTPVDFTSIVEPSSADRNLIDTIITFAKTKMVIEPYSVPDCTLTTADYERGLTVDE